MPWHILAPSAVACDNLHLRASAHLRHVSAFLFNRKFHRNFLLNKKAVVYHYSNMTALYFYAANTPITFLK